MVGWGEPAGPFRRPFDRHGPTGQRVTYHVGQRRAPSRGRPPEQVQLAGAHPHVGTEGAPDLPQPGGCHVGVIGQLGDQGAATTTGEDHLDAAADPDGVVEVVTDRIVEEAVQVQRLDLDDAPGDPGTGAARRVRVDGIADDSLPYAPTADFRSSARSVDSQVNLPPVRPKWP